MPTEQRVACFDNDGTLWCERPTYVQLDFFVDALKTAVQPSPTSRETPEFAALLAGDTAAMGELGLERIALALTGLCEGISPEEFTEPGPRRSWRAPRTRRSAVRCAATSTSRCSS